jgi:hypothetical protein
MDWDPLDVLFGRPGRLDESEAEAHQILGAGSSHRAGGLILRMGLASRKTRAGIVAQSPRAARTSFRTAIPHLGRNLAPFHFARQHVIRQRSHTIPSSVTRGERVVVYPKRTEVRFIRDDRAACYDKRHRVWTLPANDPFLATASGREMTTQIAWQDRAKSLSSRRAVKDPRAAAANQKYIERAAEDAERAKEEIEHDVDGPISLGNIGRHYEQRRDFWAAVAARETRVNARLQSRIIFELPHWLEPQDRRIIVERFGEEFSNRGLGYWVAVHLPNVARGGDPRNVHGHLNFSDRPVIGWGIRFDVDPATNIRKAVREGPIFGPKKDVYVQSRDWLADIKARFTKIVNERIEAHAARTGRQPPYFFFPGSYADLGIEAPSRKHLGPKEMAMVQNGVATSRAVRNIGVNETEILGRQGRALETLIDRANRLMAYEEEVTGLRPHPTQVSEFNVETKVHELIAGAIRSFLDETENPVRDGVDASQTMQTFLSNAAASPDGRLPEGRSFDERTERIWTTRRWTVEELEFMIRVIDIFFAALTETRKAIEVTCAPLHGTDLRIENSRTVASHGEAKPHGSLRGESAERPQPKPSNEAPRTAAQRAHRSEPSTVPQRIPPSSPLNINRSVAHPETIGKQTAPERPKGPGAVLPPKVNLDLVLMAPAQGSDSERRATADALVKQLSDEMLPIVHAHTRAAYDLAMHQLRRIVSARNAEFAASLHIAVQALESAARNRSIKLGLAPTSLTPQPQSPNQKER